MKNLIFHRLFPHINSDDVFSLYIGYNSHLYSLLLNPIILLPETSIISIHHLLTAVEFETLNSYYSHLPLYVFYIEALDEIFKNKSSLAIVYVENQNTYTHVRQLVRQSKLFCIISTNTLKRLQHNGKGH
jgi:hypothetical protein